MRARAVPSAPRATEDSLVQFAAAALTGAGVCRYTRPVARGTPAHRAATPARGGCHETPAFWPDAACITRAGTGCGDRKSTRLNSSHGYISYAVFCLKKKKRGCSYAYQDWQHT